MKNIMLSLIIICPAILYAEDAKHRTRQYKGKEVSELSLAIRDIRFAPNGNMILIKPKDQANEYEYKQRIIEEINTIRGLSRAESARLINMRDEQGFTPFCRVIDNFLKRVRSGTITKVLVQNLISVRELDVNAKCQCEKNLNHATKFLDDGIKQHVDTVCRREDTVIEMLEKQYSEMYSIENSSFTDDYYMLDIGFNLIASGVSYIPAPTNEQGLNFFAEHLVHKFMNANDYDTVYDFIVTGTVSINAKNRYGRPFLHEASGDEFKQRFLLSLGANLESLNRVGDTPLLTYVQRGADIGLLLMFNADVTARSLNSGKQAIHFAVEGSFKQGYVARVIEQLSKAGADLSVRDGDGNTPFCTAMRRGELETAQLLVSKGVEPDVTQCSGFDQERVNRLFKTEKVQTQTQTPPVE